MDIHVDSIGGKVEGEKDDRLPAGEQQPPIGLLHRMEDRTIAKRTAADDQVLQAAAGQVILGATHKAMHRDLAVVGLHLDEPVAQLDAEQVADSRPPRACHGQVVDSAAVVGEAEAHRGMGEGRAYERLRGMRPLGLRCPEKRPPCRHVAEQLVHLDGGTDRTSLGHDLAGPATVDRDRGANALGRPRPDHQPRHFTDAGQRLAAEAERADPLEVLGNAKLARGMGRHRQRQVLGLDTAAVIHHADQGNAPLFERHVDPRR